MSIQLLTPLERAVTDVITNYTILHNYAIIVYLQYVGA